jgi:hypothetical protein
MGVAIKTDMDRAAPSENLETYHARQSSRNQPWNGMILEVLPHGPRTLTKSGKVTTVHNWDMILYGTDRTFLSFTVAVAHEPRK